MKKDYINRLKNLIGINNVKININEGIYWRISFEVKRNSIDSWQTISKIRILVHKNSGLLIYRKPSPFLVKNKKNEYELVVENTDNLISIFEFIDQLVFEIKNRNGEYIKESETFDLEKIKTEGEFLFSWDEIEKFYRFSFLDQHHSWKKSALDFIGNLRRLGYDKKFRAGQQLSNFIISQCKDHGMHRSQKHIIITFQNENSMKVKLVESEVEIKTGNYLIGLSKDLVKILEEFDSKNKP